MNLRFAQGGVTGGGTDISGASVTVNTSGKPVGAFTYATLATPVTLSANTAYYVMCYESSGGDYWGDWDNAVATTSAATISSSVYNVGGGYGNVGTGSFTYGPISLRYQTGSGSGGSTPTGETRYLYMGRLVVQERDGNNTPTVSYTRGWDLSGSFEGAGGIGGLLARSHGYSGGSWSSHNAYHSDGNGNITALVDTAQNVSASYRYDPYGNLLSSSGTMADANVYRFSSKEFVETGEIYYYGFRFYDPNFQRWLNRDPIAEDGGVNLSAFVLNQPVSRVDPLGLMCLNPFNPDFWAQFFEKAAKIGEPRTVDPNSNLALLAEEGMAPSGFEGADGTKVSGAKVAAMVAGGVGAGLVSAVTSGVGGGSGGAIGNTGRATAKALPIPDVADAKLANLARDLYKGAKTLNPIGTGSTADAVRNELLTGLQTGGKFHSDKAKQYIVALEKWLKKNPNASQRDRLVAESMKNDLQCALAGK